MQNDPIKKTTLRYKDAGVDIEKGNAFIDQIKPLAKSTYRKGVMDSLGGFGGLFDLKSAGFEDPILVAASDGVGTKLKFALEYQELSYIGVDLVAMCVNDLICQGAEPLFFLDYLAVGTLDLARGTKIVEGISNGCRQSGCALIGGETAEMPGVYLGEDFDLAGFALGAYERGRALPSDIQQGDKILGLPSSGVHSNGYSLVRKLLSQSPHDLTYRLSDGKSLGDALIAPTRIYVSAVVNLMRDNLIKGAAHITGGGLSENLPRILPNECGASINLDAIPKQSIFDFLIREAALSHEDALQTFNCGIGMCLICGEEMVTNAIKQLEEAGEHPVLLGEVTSSARIDFEGSL